MMPGMPESQTTADVLMIRPASFCANTQTAESNRFQQPEAQHENAQELARSEFDALATALRRAGVRVHIFDDPRQPETPDALFPNNWVSFHADGSVVLYPMMAPNRRLERRLDILESLTATHGFRASRVIDLTQHEDAGRFLEGTGSLVLDRLNRIAYACLSPRTDLQVLGEFAQQLDYDIVAFEALDRRGAPIYHTNVLMSIGSKFAVVCVESIRPDQRAAVLDSLQATGHVLIEIDHAQMNAFAGNILELSTVKDEAVIALSDSAQQALTPQQRDQLTSLAGPLVAASIPTIETLGGGSVRCMLAEIHLPRTDSSRPAVTIARS